MDACDYRKSIREVAEDECSGVGGFIAVDGDTEVEFLDQNGREKQELVRSKSASTRELSWCTVFVDDQIDMMA